jgi:NADH:ubiquinone oxidoreductase subunit H
LASFQILLDVVISYTITNYDDLETPRTSAFYLLPLIADSTTPFAVKLTLSIMFLIVIRGCVPRYRYDLLTKMGWVKFLGYVLMIFIAAIMLFLLW